MKTLILISGLIYSLTSMAQIQTSVVPGAEGHLDDRRAAESECIKKAIKFAKNAESISYSVPLQNIVTNTPKGGVYDWFKFTVTVKTRDNRYERKGTYQVTMISPECKIAETIKLSFHE